MTRSEAYAVLSRCVQHALNGCGREDQARLVKALEVAKREMLGEKQGEMRLAPEPLLTPRPEESH